MENQNTIEHFHWGHFGAILLCAVFLIGITIMRNGFQFKPLFSEAKKTVTYAEIRAQVEKNNPELVAVATNGGEFTEENMDQIAMIDRSLNEGNVLGASTEENIFPAEKLFSPDNLKKISVKTLPYTNAEAVKKYSDQLSAVEASYDTLGLLGNFSSGSTDALEQNAKITPLVIGELSQVAVPKDLEEYHRYKIVYYTVLQVLAEMKLGKLSDENFSEMSNIFMSVMQKITSFQSSIKDKYSINLQ